MQKVDATRRVVVVAVIGPVLMVIILVVGLPVAFMASGALVSVVLGQTLWRDGEKRFPGDERVELNR